jgi:hypothetical protein
MLRKFPITHTITIINNVNSLTLRLKQHPALFLLELHPVIDFGIELILQLQPKMQRHVLAIRMSVIVQVVLHVDGDDVLNLLAVLAEEMGKL